MDWRAEKGFASILLTWTDYHITSRPFRHFVKFICPWSAHGNARARAVVLQTRLKKMGRKNEKGAAKSICP